MYVTEQETSSLGLLVHSFETEIQTSYTKFTTQISFYFQLRLMFSATYDTNTLLNTYKKKVNSIIKCLQRKAI